MTKFFVLSAYQTSAGQFFGTLIECGADLVLDVRRKNSSQLCGFTKKKDLEYLVPKVTRATYVHDLRFAPDDDLLQRYLDHRINWDEYRRNYIEQMCRTNALNTFSKDYESYRCICILGAGTDKRKSHSEILAELLSGGNERESRS